MKDDNAITNTVACTADTNKFSIVCKHLARQAREEKQG